MRRFSWLLFLAMAGTVACVGDDDDTDGIPGDDDDDDDDDVGEARVRVVNFAPSVHEMDVVLLERDDDDARDDSVRFDDVDFSDATAYRRVEDGPYTLRVLDEDDDDDDVDDLLFQTTVDLLDDQDHTLVIWGSDDDDLRLLRVIDDLTELPGGQARVIIAHVAAGQGEVDVLAVNGMTAILADDLQAGEQLQLDIDPGERTIALDLDDDGDADLLYELPNLRAGEITHLLLGFDDDDDDDDLVLLVVDDDGDTQIIRGMRAAGNLGFVRFLNLSDDDDLSVDIWVDECPMPSVFDLDEFDDTPYLPVIPGSYTLHVVRSGQHPDQALFDIELDIDANERMSFTLFDDVGEGRVFRLLDDNSDIQDGEVRLQFANASAELGNVGVYTIVDGTPVLLVTLPFGDTRFTDVPLEDTLIGLDVDADGDIDKRYRLVGDDDQESINLYLLGDDDDPDILAQFEDGGLHFLQELDD